MKIYIDQELAETTMREWNRGHADVDMIVLVDGPEDGQVALMPLVEAIKNDFLYRWSV